MSTNSTPQKRSQHRYFINSRGKKLLARHWCSDQPVSNLLLLPGFSEHSARYQPIASKISEQSCNVYSLDYEGHGKSDGLKGDIREFSYYVDDVQQYLTALKEENDEPFWLMGHGMGALIAIQLAHRLKGKKIIEAMVLSAPLFAFGSEVPRIVQETAKYVSTMAATFPILSIEQDWLSKDADALKAYADDPLNYHGKLRARIASHLIVNGKKAKDLLFDLDLPVLLFHSTDDHFADPNVVSEMGNSDSKPESFTIKMLEERGHMLLFEKGWKDMVDEIIKWSGPLCQIVSTTAKVEK